MCGCCLISIEVFVAILDKMVDSCALFWLVVVAVTGVVLGEAAAVIWVI